MTRIKAPARICLFGDHQDYLGLPVIACAIDRYIEFNALPNSSNTLRFDFIDLNEKRSVNLDQQYNNFGPRDYILSSLYLLQQRGIQLESGYDIEVYGNIPINAGLSSSSAFVVAWITLLLKLSSRLNDYTAVEIGQMGYEAECVLHKEAGGKMDQYTAAIGNTVYIDTSRDLSYESLIFPTDALLVANSGIPKETLDGLRTLNERTHAAIAKVTQQYPDLEIAKVGLGELGQYLKFLDEEQGLLFEAAVRNHTLTLEAVKGIRLGTADPPFLGALMFEHHKVLRDFLKITTPEIDTLINTAMEAGAFGCKIVGSGGGGCIACIAPQAKKDEILSALNAAGAAVAFEAMISEGAKELAE